MRKEFTKMREIDTFLSRPSRMTYLPMERVNQARVVLFGAGAIGSSMIPLLVNSGIMHIVFVDKDVLERSNYAKTSMVYDSEEDLNKPKALAAAKRAKEGMLSGGEAFGIQMDIYDLGEKFLAPFDYAVSCVDDVEVRKYLNHLCKATKTPFFETGTHGLIAESQCYDYSESCYCCNAPYSAEKISCAVQYAREIEDGNAPSCQLSSTLAAAFCTENLLKAICGYHVRYNVQHYHDGNTGETSVFAMKKNPLCMECSVGEEPCPVYEFLGDVKHKTRRELEGEIEKRIPGKTSIYWPGTFVEEDYCPVCGKRKKILSPARRVKKESLYCRECLGQEENFRYLNTKAKVYEMCDTPGEEIRDMDLFSLGYPIGGPIMVFHREEEKFYKIYLKDDLKLVLPKQWA